jgi:hypothetical protein
MTSTISNGNTSRKQLSSQLDRLDTILDGLAEALNESVASAVKDTVGQVVKEAVETTIREVLSNPDLLQAALMQQMPVQPPVSRSLGGVFKNALAALLHLSDQALGKVKNALGCAWNWALGKLGKVSAIASSALQRCSTAASLAWQWRWTCATALGVGVVAGVAVYHAGPMIASVVCGIGSALATTAGITLAPVWRLLFGSGHSV